MRETVEFRIPEYQAARFLKPEQGRRVGQTVRALEVAVGSPEYERVGEIRSRLLARENHGFFHGWVVRRRYTQRELDSAELLQLVITSTFEPAGEECGTGYDESGSCPLCGAGRKQISDLFLDMRKVPRTKDVSRSIADEWIVSERLAGLLGDAKMSGFELRPVHHKGYYHDDPVDPRQYPAGKELHRRAAAAGAPYPTPRYWQWVNELAQLDLLAQLDRQYAAAMKENESRWTGRFPKRYQLVVAAKRPQAVPPTRFGIDPFNEDEKGEYRCPKDHVSGLNLLSEVFVTTDQWDGSDVACTENLVGVRRGLLVPAPIILISPRLNRLLKEQGITGYRVEVAHLV